MLEEIDLRSKANQAVLTAPPPDKVAIKTTPGTQTLANKEFIKLNEFDPSVTACDAMSEPT